VDDIALGAKFGNTLAAKLGKARLLRLISTAGSTVEAGLMQGFGKRRKIHDFIL
jgi:hypothetical protein